MTSAPDTRERILQAGNDLVFERGFTGTTVDAILEATGASKGAFFHHFPTKAALGKALIERYAALDADVLERNMQDAEARTDDPIEQLVLFIQAFEVAVETGELTQPGCLFASYAYEQIPDEAGFEEIVRGAISLWRDRILAKLDQAAASRPPAAPVDLPSLADQVWTVFEGGFLLARVTGNQLHLRDQLRHLRTYLSLLFDGVEGGASS